MISSNIRQSNTGSSEIKELEELPKTHKLELCYFMKFAAFIAAAQHICFL